MRHAQPLKYEFMTKLRNMMPEALEKSDSCVIQQCAILLHDTEENLTRDFDLLFTPARDSPPYNGKDWREVGITTELMVAFAEYRSITLNVFFWEP